ncbi:MAG: hypothetical protein R3224_11010 [Balneolaceae bacterium]|nr:hypothetical protein [Balneolaceae bacterium]
MTLEMESRAYKLLPKLTNPVMKYFVRKAIARDMDAVKTFCESVDPPGPAGRKLSP